MLEQRILEGLFRHNYSEMIHLARILLGNDEEAEDVVQDIFLRVARCDIPTTDKAYLMTAVRNACMNRIRQMKVHEQVKSLLPVAMESELQPIDSRSERVDDIMAFVDGHFEELHRSIFHLRFDDDLTVVEIARRLGMNANTTYKYLMQSIQRIKLHFTR